MTGGTVAHGFDERHAVTPGHPHVEQDHPVAARAQQIEGDLAVLRLGHAEACRSQVPLPPSTAHRRRRRPRAHRRSCAASRPGQRSRCGPRYLHASCDRVVAEGVDRGRRPDLGSPATGRRPSCTSCALSAGASAANDAGSWCLPPCQLPGRFDGETHRDDGATRLARFRLRSPRRGPRSGAARWPVRGRSLPTSS